MQTRTYGDLFKLVQSFAGVTAFSDNEQDDIANLINRRYQSAYNTSQIWPRYLVIGEKRNINSFVILPGLGVNTYDNLLFYKVGKDGSSPFSDVYIPSNITVGTNDTLNVRKTFDSGTTNSRWRLFQNTRSLGTQVGSGAGVFFNLVDKVWNATNTGITFFFQADVESNLTTPISYDNPADVEQYLEGQNFGVAQVGGQLLLKKVCCIGFDEKYEADSNTGFVTSKPTIGEFIRIHKQKPFLNNSSLEYDFFVDDLGAHILNKISSEDSYVYVTYKKPFTAFTTSSNFTTSTEEVPGEFFQYIAYGSYADFLRMDGQHNKAQLEDQNAEFALAQQLERVDAIMNNNTINKKFSTYVNRQSR